MGWGIDGAQERVRGMGGGGGPRKRGKYAWRKEEIGERLMIG